MGGLSRYLPYTTGADVDRRARARRRAAVLGLLLEGSDPRRRARARRLGRLHGLGPRPRGRVRDRALHVPADAARLPRRAERLRAPARRGARRARRGAVLDALDDRRAGRRRALRGPARDPAASTHGMRNFLEPTIPGGIEATGDRRSSAPRRWPSRSRSSASSPPTCCGAGAATRRAASPRRPAPLERVLQDKFGFDRLYDWAFYRPAVGGRARRRSGSGRTRAVLGSMNVVSAARLVDEPPALDARSPASCASTRSRSRSASPRSPPG